LFPTYDGRASNSARSFHTDSIEYTYTHPLFFFFFISFFDGWTDFACKRNLPVKLEPVSAPPHKFSTTYELWQTLLEAEQNNTQALQKLADAAMKDHDHVILAFLQPFHIEQVESEDQLGTILAKIKDEQQTPGLLRLLDQELSQSSATHVA
jgi:ferritin